MLPGRLSAIAYRYLVLTALESPTASVTMLITRSAPRLSLPSAALLLLVVPGCTQKPDDAAIMRQNAAEQAAALNQDPGGADRPSIESVSSATILATGEEVPFEWRSGDLRVVRSAHAPERPHEVVAVRVKRAQ